MKKAFFLVFALFLALSIHGTTYWVTTVNNAGTGTFRAAVDSALDGDTIRFNPTLLANGNDTIKLMTPISIFKKITVKGLFSATDTLFISGQNTSRILIVDMAQAASSPKNITLDSLALINGNADVYLQGGCLYVGAGLDTLFLNNTVLRNGQAKYGGGMYCGTTTLSTAKPPLVIVSGCKFQNNVASLFGGGICTYFAKIRTQQCGLSGNSAERGGGIYFHAEYFSELFNTALQNNTALENGGGFYAHFTDSVFVKNSKFYNNYALSNGGAMYSSGKLDVSKTLVDSNEAGVRAGGIYFGYFGSVMDVDSCVISRNKATFGGGANAQSEMNYSYTSFNSNTGSQGAGLYFTSAPVNVLGCTFSNNAGNSGGAIYAGQYGTLNVNKSTIVNNSASAGGGIYCFTPYSANSFSMTNSTMANNEGLFGAGIYFRTSATFPLNATFTSSIVINNAPVNVQFSNDTITSLGFNIFGDSAVLGSIATDQVNVHDSLVNLHALGNFGGFTQTAPPSIGSVAINAGNPMDLSSAQNGVLTGTRDVGAAEAVGIFRDTLTACTQVFWYQNTFTNSGNYVKLLPNGDTVATLNLTIIPFTMGVDVISGCSSFTWIDGTTYTTSNSTATDTLVNSIGCDSIVTLNLTILPQATGVDVISACGSFIWIDGLTYTASNNTATDTLLNINGCDSIVTLNLTILSPTSGTDQIFSCGNYTWMDGVTYTASNNTATHTLLNAAGCDSVVTLDLTVHTTNIAVTITGSSITANAAFASYQWLDCNNNYAFIPGETAQIFTATANGNYAVQIAELGCVDTSACVLVSNIGEGELAQEKQFIAYPNPAKEFLQLSFLWPDQEKQIVLLNTVGQEILNKKTSKTELRLDVSQLPVGIYVLQVSSINKIYSQRVVIGK